MVEVASDTNVLSESRCQVLCRHRQQSSLEQFRQNEPPKSNAGIGQTQGQRIAIGKGYCEGGQGEDREFTLVEEDGLEEHVLNCIIPFLDPLVTISTTKNRVCRYAFCVMTNCVPFCA